MRLYASFGLAGHLFQATMPDSPGEPQEWTISVEKDGQLVRRDTLPMIYAPRFGADAGDVQALNERVEQIIAEMGLE